MPKDGKGRPYWVYVIQSEQTRVGKRGKKLPGFYYVGMTTDPARRLRQHNGELVGGGKYTSKHRPWVARSLFGPYPDRSSALKAEYRLKHSHRGASRVVWASEDPWCIGAGPDHPWVKDSCLTVGDFPAYRVNQLPPEGDTT